MQTVDQIDLPVGTVNALGSSGSTSLVSSPHEQGVSDPIGCVLSERLSIISRPRWRTQTLNVAHIFTTTRGRTMKHRALITAVVAMSVCSLSVPLAAQSTTSPYDPNPALWQVTPDAAALGFGGRGFLSYGVDEWNRQWMVSGGLGLFGGMLHATYGKSSKVGAPLEEYAIGYARRLTDWNLGPWMSWGAGFDLTAAAQRSPFSPYESKGVRLMVPLSFRLGSPTGLSIAPYVGPYTEYGSAYLVRGCLLTNSCGGARMPPGSTHSTGLAFGAEVTLWRLGFTLGALGVPDGMRAFRPGWQGTGAVRIRF